jgi:protein disulfide-isomerase
MAQNVGVQGVLLLDNKYAVSGAQHIETFVKTLEKSGKKAILNQNYCIELSK